MKITHSKFLKYLYFAILASFFLLTFHILYVYIVESIPSEYIKGGTIVQGSLEGGQYLPYLSDHSQDKLIQSFLFNACYNPIATGTNIEFEEDLCDVKTKDYKTFDITIKPNKTWSDGTQISIDDLYFTYNDILKKNAWNLKGFDIYQNLEIYTGDTLRIIFPTSTIDNRIFLTNYILPSHILKNKNIEFYLQSFGKEPIKSNCGELQKDTKDSQSVVFDLSGCSDSFIQNYQIKSFSDQPSMEEFISKNPKTIDFFLDSVDIKGFEKQKFVVNKFSTVFFNTKSDYMTTDFRKAFSKIILDEIYTGSYENYLIKDNFIFDAQPKGGDIKAVLEDMTKRYIGTKTTKASTGTTSSTTPQNENSNELKNLPSTINAGPGESTFFLGKLENTFTLRVKFGESFERVSVSRNGKDSYALKSYKQGDKTAVYNLSEKFSNIEKGKNIYKFVGYNGKKETTIINITVYYIDKPQQDSSTSAQTTTGEQNTGLSISGDQTVIQELSGINAQNEKKTFKIKVLYMNEPTSEYVGERLKAISEKHGIEDYFEFTEFTNSDDFDNRIKSKDYDIVIRGIDMGLKKDISNLFSTEDPLINPSMYQSTNLNSLVNQYFITKSSKEKVKDEIDKLYAAQMPIILIGKIYDNFYARNDAKLEIPERLYDFWFAKDYVIKTKLVKNTKLEELDRKKIFNLDNFKKFINDYGFNSKILEE